MARKTEERGLVDRVPSGCVLPTSAFVKIYEEKLFAKQSERRRIKEVFQEVEEGIEVPVVSLCVYKQSTSNAPLACGSAIILNPHEDIGNFTAATVPSGRCLL